MFLTTFLCMNQLIVPLDLIKLLLFGFAGGDRRYQPCQVPQGTAWAWGRRGEGRYRRGLAYQAACQEQELCVCYPHLCVIFFYGKYNNA